MVQQLDPISSASGTRFASGLGHARHRGDRPNYFEASRPRAWSAQDAISFAGAFATGLAVS